MSDRADAHIHVFEKGFQGSFTGRPGVEIEEALLYASLAEAHGVKHALVVAYEGENWAIGNNGYVARVMKNHKWMRPVAFVELAHPMDLDALESYRTKGFVGISLYVFGDESVGQLQGIPDETWSWIEKHHWLISVNSRGKDWRAWLPILDMHPDLRVIASHLGLPKRMAEPPSAEEAGRQLADVLTLAWFEHTHVKLSGFYAISDPGHAYPHRASWPYVETLIKAFTPRRLVWGSDFTPSLDWLSFPQTFGVFSEMPFLDEADRRRIEGENLMGLLKAATA